MRPLHFHRRASRPRLRWVLVQVGFGLALILFGAVVFVENVALVSKAVGISPLVLSLIITPMATELTDKFNSITWMRDRKDRLALGNITGAMVFQSSVLPAVGIVFIPRELDAKTLASIVTAVAATFLAWAEMTIRKRLSPHSLATCGLLNLLYSLFVLVVLPKL